ncbi:MAG: hypothetical protein WCC26_19265 [Terracidiphilus sp.]
MQRTESGHAASAPLALPAKAQTSVVAECVSRRADREDGASQRGDANRSARQERSNTEKGSGRSAKNLLSTETPVRIETPTTLPVQHALQPEVDFPTADKSQDAASPAAEGSLKTVGKARNAATGEQSLAVGGRLHLSMAAPARNGEAAQATDRRLLSTEAPAIAQPSTTATERSSSRLPNRVQAALTDDVTSFPALDGRARQQQNQATSEPMGIRAAPAVQALEMFSRREPLQAAASDAGKAPDASPIPSNLSPAYPMKTPSLSPPSSSSSDLLNKSDRKSGKLDSAAHEVEQPEPAAALDWHPAQSATSLGRDPQIALAPLPASAAMHGAASATSAGDTRTQQTFAAMEAGPSPLSSSWTHATATTAEAGYLDPALGWVGVRAQTDATGIHAAVVPASAPAGEMLQGHLSGLGSYLADHRVHIESVSITPAEGSLNAKSDLASGGGHEGHGNNRETAQPGPEGNTSEAAPRPLRAQVALHRDATLSQPVRVAGRGAHISVMA